MFRFCLLFAKAADLFFLQFFFVSAVTNKVIGLLYALVDYFGVVIN